MMKHTEGPWEWNVEDGSIESSRGGGIAFVHPHGNINTIARTGEQYSHADARLISASPDFFAACETMLVNEQCGGDGWWKGFEMLKAAYVKAGGELR